MLAGQPTGVTLNAPAHPLYETQPGRFRPVRPAMGLMSAGQERMLRDIEEETLLTRGRTGRAALSPRVMEAMAAVPREAFVGEPMQGYAFANGPLPIGHGQTISQPFIVALMTDLLEPRPDDVVLEVGTGSGYQTAVLAELVGRVYTTEIVEPLYREARERLDRLGYANVETRLGDGYHGWPEHAPYGGILVTAASPEVPPPLIEQLRIGGRMVIPVGPVFGPQELIVVEKPDRDRIETREALAVAFVPLTGEH